MSGLKSCPFCGRKPHLELFNDGFFDYARIRCCDLIFNWCDDKTGEKVVTAWNRRADRWIPVSEGKPYEKSCHYLVLSKMNIAHGGTWENNDGDARRNMSVAYFDCTGAFNVPYVTHWMPLPEPPEEEGEQS